jgi:putative SOS response-associated peptidase YedK
MAEPKPRTAIRRLVELGLKAKGVNLPPMPGVFPDYPAPVVRNNETGTDPTTMRWGMPPPLRTPGPPVTNIRNTSSSHWRGWLKPESRGTITANSLKRGSANDSERAERRSRPKSKSRGSQQGAQSHFDHLNI